MALFRRKPRVSEEELLARENPLLTPGQWEEMLGSRRALHHRLSTTRSREFRKDWKYILLGALLGAVVVGVISAMAKGIWIWRIEGYDTQGVSMIERPSDPYFLFPILKEAALAGALGGFMVFFIRRLWRRR